MKPSISSDKELRERTTSNLSPHLSCSQNVVQAKSPLGKKKQQQTHFYLISIS